MMKPEEAISFLKSWRITGDKAHEAVNMSIEALRCRCRNGCNFKEAKIGESTTEFGCRNCNEMIQGEQNE